MFIYYNANLEPKVGYSQADFDAITDHIESTIAVTETMALLQSESKPRWFVDIINLDFDPFELVEVVKDWGKGKALLP